MCTTNSVKTHMRGSRHLSKIPRSVEANIINDGKYIISLNVNHVLHKYIFKLEIIRTWTRSHSPWKSFLIQLHHANYWSQKFQRKKQNSDQNTDWPTLNANFKAKDSTMKQWQFSKSVKNMATARWRQRKSQLLDSSLHSHQSCPTGSQRLFHPSHKATGLRYCW